MHAYIIKTYTYLHVLRHMYNQHMHRSSTIHTQVYQQHMQHTTSRNGTGYKSPGFFPDLSRSWWCIYEANFEKSSALLCVMHTCMNKTCTRLLQTCASHGHIGLYIYIYIYIYIYRVRYMCILSLSIYIYIFMYMRIYMTMRCTFLGSQSQPCWCFEGD